MKRLLWVTLALLVLFLLPACSEASEVTATLEDTLTVTKEPEETKKEETKTFDPTPWDNVERVYEKVETPLTPERIAEIPVANANMSSEELRQICVDYVCLSTTFQWVPSTDFKYVAEGQGAPVTFYEGQLYGGLPYVNIASGNLYRAIELYDTETGVMDMLPFRKSKLTYGTACSGTAGWGWNRVVNSAKIGWTSGMTVKNGFIRLGNYTYSDTIDRYDQVEGNDCSDIAKANGKELMYECYALILKADCLVNNGHVRMAKENAVVVRDENGKIDGKNSYVIQCEQGLYTTSEIHDRYTSDGTKYKIQGNDNLKTTFAELYKSGYLPHTFGEFIGTDPVEKAVATIEHSGETASVTDLLPCKVVSNYVISHLVVTIYDKDQNAVATNTSFTDNHFTKSLLLSTALPGSAAIQYQESGDCTILVEAVVSTGERLTVYRGTLAQTSA